MGTLNKARKLLIFNPKKVLVAVCPSLSSGAQMLKIPNKSSVHKAATGETISCSGLYFRYLPDDMELEFEDLGTLKLQEFDAICGEDRKLFKNSSMTRKGLRYSRKRKSNKQA